MFFFVGVVVFLLCPACSQGLEDVECANVPIFSVTATSSYELGLQTGKLSANLTLSYFAVSPVLSGILTPFSQTARGAAMVARWEAQTRALFPAVAEEIDGLADGIGWPRPNSWLVNMQEEILAAVSGPGGGEHCSDVLVNYGAGSGFRLHGHNEDGDPDVARYAFFLNATLNESSLFYFMYPGQIAGTSFGFRGGSGSRFLYSQSENSLSPSTHGMDPQAGGVPVNMLARASLFAQSPSEAIAVVAAVNASWGMNLNFLTGVDDEGAVDLEVGPGSGRALRIINPRPGNLPASSHFNQYLWMLVESQKVDVSSEMRAKRVTELGVPTTVQAMREILGDTHNKRYPIFRDGQSPDPGATLATQIVDLGGEGLATVYLWCGGNPKTTTPMVLQFS